MDHTLSVDLPGLIDLLGRRLHDHPGYLIRDLLRLAADSIRAREALDPDHSGSILIEVHSGKTRTLAFLDDGIGLTEDQARESLGTIGGPGVGVLSCFGVTDSITVISKSARPGSHPVVEWRGLSDGTYSLRTFDREMNPGTQVYLACNPQHEETFTFEELCDDIKNFAEFLPCPIRVLHGEESVEIPRTYPPWRRRFTSTKQQTRELLEFGRRVFDLDFLDAIPLRSKVGEVEGVAFVLPYRPGPLDLEGHRVCLDGLLLAESAIWLSPLWAYFVTCVVDIGGLRPTTSRTAILDGDELEAARDSIGRCLRDYLVGVAARDPEKLTRLLAIHGHSIKCLACDDDEFYRLFIDLLVFETSMGEMTIGDLRRRFGPVLFVDDEGEFRLISPILSARGLCVVRAATQLDVELLTRMPQLVEGAEAQQLDMLDWAIPLEMADAEENRPFRKFAAMAEEVLRPYSCSVSMESYPPDDPPALFSPALDSLPPEVIEEIMQADPPEFAADPRRAYPACLSLNTRHPLIRDLATVQDRTRQGRVIEMLYLQALLAGRYPLGPLEMALVGGGLIDVLKDHIAG